MSANMRASRRCKRMKALRGGARRRHRRGEAGLVQPGLTSPIRSSAATAWRSSARRGSRRTASCRSRVPTGRSSKATRKTKARSFRSTRRSATSRRRRCGRSSAPRSTALPSLDDPLAPTLAQAARRHRSRAGARADPSPAGARRRRSSAAARRAHLRIILQEFFTLQLALRVRRATRGGEDEDAEDRGRRRAARRGADGSCRSG